MEIVCRPNRSSLIIQRLRIVAKVLKKIHMNSIIELKIQHQDFLIRLLLMVDKQGLMYSLCFLI
jgi:hypothetical protein